MINWLFSIEESEKHVVKLDKMTYASLIISSINAPYRHILHSLAREVLVMKIYYITFRSVTFAQRGEQLLQKSGIRAALLRTPKWMESQGCGYSLRIRTE